MWSLPVLFKHMVSIKYQMSLYSHSSGLGAPGLLTKVLIRLRTIFIGYLLDTQHCSKHFAYIVSLNPLKTPRWISLGLIYRWRKWGRERQYVMYVKLYSMHKGTWIWRQAAQHPNRCWKTLFLSVSKRPEGRTRLQKAERALGTKKMLVNGEKNMNLPSTGRVILGERREWWRPSRDELLNHMQSQREEANREQSYIGIVLNKPSINIGNQGFLWWSNG